MYTRKWKDYTQNRSSLGEMGTQGNNWHVNSLHEEMGSVPREEDETSVMAGALQLEQHGEPCVNCSKNTEPPPSGLSQWGTVGVLGCGTAEETGHGEPFPYLCGASGWHAH